MFNLNNVGTPIAIIDGGIYHNRIVYQNKKPELEIPQSSNYINLGKNNGKFEIIPDPFIERNIFYITGPSGSGKSTLTRKIIQQWQKLKRENKNIFVFSNLKKDESLDSIKNLKRFKLDNELITNPIQIEDLKNSIVIFDDTDCIKDKEIREAVIKVMDEILETGRHFNINVIVTNHLPTDGKTTKKILNEAHYVIYFPHSGNKRGTEYLCTEYLGLDKKDVKAIKKTGSRWACYYKNYPQYVLTETAIFNFNEDSDED